MKDQKLCLLKGKEGKRALDLDAISGAGDTPLLRAIHNCNAELVEVLTSGSIQKGFSNINKSCPCGQTALIKALSFRGADEESKERALRIVRHLIRKGANVNLEDRRGMTPLWAALQCADTMSECIPLLISKKADINVLRSSNDYGPCTLSDSITPIMASVLNRDSKTCELLTGGKSLDINKRCNYAGILNTTVVIEAVRMLGSAQKNSCLSIILEKKGSEVQLNARNANGETAAKIASELSDKKLKFEVLELLVDCQGQDEKPVDLSVENVGHTLCEIVRSKDEKGALRLMEKLADIGKADVNSPDFLPLNVAIYSTLSWSARMMELLMQHGADVNKSPYQDPPLHCCVKQLIKAQSTVQDAESAEKDNYLRLCAEKLAIVAKNPAVDRSARINKQTALDVLLAPHSAVLRRLENCEYGFWKRASTSKDYGEGRVKQYKSDLFSARDEVEKWAQLIEPEPRRREEFLRQASDTLEKLDILLGQLSVWRTLHEALLKYEVNQIAPPSLAGRDWSDLRYKLSHPAEDSDQGLTTINNLRSGKSKAKRLRPEALAWAPQPPQLANLKSKREVLPPVVDPHLRTQGEQLFLKNKAILEYEQIEVSQAGNLRHDDLLEIGIAEEDAVPLLDFLRMKEGGQKETNEGPSGDPPPEQYIAVDAIEAPENASGSCIALPLATDSDSDDDMSDDDISDDDSKVDLMMSRLPENIELTRYAFNWIQKAEKKHITMFIKKIQLLAEGPSAWKRNQRGMGKALKGQLHTPSRYPVRETKLNKSMRILWQERGAILENEATAPRSGKEAILVWYIVKHKEISTKLQDIDRCFQRMNVIISSASMQAAFKGGSTLNTPRHETIPEVLLDPTGNTPLRIFDVMIHELPQLESARKWIPPMRLTASEERIVNTEGLVTILGRSGTGKTVCVAMRMHKDRLRAAKGNSTDFRQVFIARSTALCSQVRDMVKDGGCHAKMNKSVFNRSIQAISGPAEEMSTSAVDADESERSTSVSSIEDLPEPKFVTIDDFADLIESSIADTSMEPQQDGLVQRQHWNRIHRVEWHQFEKDFWPTISKRARKSRNGHNPAVNKLAGRGGTGLEEQSEIVALTAWVQIKSLIKGSVEAAWGGGPTIFSDISKPDSDGTIAETRPCGTPLSRDEYMALDESRCALTPNQRSIAYEYYEIYMQWLCEKGELSAHSLIR